MARLIDPDTAQEWADDARREAERAADVAIADLRACAALARSITSDPTEPE